MFSTCSGITLYEDIFDVFMFVIKTSYGEGKNCAVVQMSSFRHMCVVLTKRVMVVCLVLPSSIFSATLELFGDIMCRVMYRKTASWSPL